MNSFYPLFIDLRDRPVLVIGGGRVASRRLPRLLDAGARVTLVSPTLHPQVETLRGRASFEWKRRRFRPADLDGAFLAFLAVGDADLLRVVRQEATARGVLLNAAEDAARCDVHVPALLERGGVRIAITTGGESPARAAEVRRRLEAGLPLQDRAPEPAPGSPADAAAPARLDGPGRRPRERSFPCGTVFLLGAGPGDPGLLTVRSREVLDRADVIFHDRLVSAEILDIIPSRAELVPVHRERRRPPLGETVEPLVAAARAGRRVVRLKGGDPMLFGRGSEEADAVRRAGVPCVVVPGVSALAAVPAAAGIPVTRRHVASELVVRSGHRAAGGAASPSGQELRGRTLVYFMAVSRMESIVAELLEEGLPPTTPAAVVEQGTTPRQRVVEAPLVSIAKKAGDDGVRPPALLVVGDVVALRAATSAGSPGDAGRRESPPPPPSAASVEGRSARRSSHA